MSSIATITVLGNLTRDPESGTMPDGTPTSRFGLAVNSRRKNEDVVTYFRANAIGKTADFANQYLSRGRQVLVIGELHQERFTKADGTPGDSLEIRVTNVTAAGSKPEGSEESGTSERPTNAGSAPGKAKGKTKAKAVVADEQDIPF